MSDKTLFTAHQSVEKISERTLYITLLSVELYSYGISHSMHDHLKKPSKLAFKYLEYNGTYLKRLQTSLRNFKSKKIDFFKINKDSLLNNFEIDLEVAIDKAVDEITNLVYKKKKKISQRAEIPIKINHKSNQHAHQYIKDLIKHMLQAPPEHGETIFLPAIPKSSIDKIENRIIEIVEKALMSKAFLHAEERANHNGEKYICKKLVKTIDEIFNDFIFYKNSNDIKSGLLDKKISKLCDEVSNKYEVIGKTDYLLNEAKFKLAIRNNFEPKIEKLKKS